MKIKKNFVAFTVLLVVLCLLTTISATTFTSKQEALDYQALTRTKGEVEIVNIMEILNKNLTEVYYKFDYKVDGNTINSEDSMIEIKPSVDLKSKAGEDAIKAALEEASQDYFNQLKSEEEIKVEYDDMKGWKYDGVKWTEV